MATIFAMQEDNVEYFYSNGTANAFSIIVEKFDLTLYNFKLALKKPEIVLRQILPHIIFTLKISFGMVI